MDYDGDGDLDVLVVDASSESAQPFFYQNRLGEDLETAFTTAFPFENGRTGAAEWGDYDNDGDLDLFIEIGWDAGRSWDLWINTGNGSFERSAFPFEPGAGSSGMFWVDYDNDGDLDLLGRANDSDGGVAFDGYRAYENLGGGQFVGHQIVDEPNEGVWLLVPAIADFDNDGFMDFFAGYDSGTGVPGDSNRDRLFRNNGNANHWLKLSLEGRSSNRSAIGAIVRVKATISGSEVWQMRMVSAGGATVSAQHDMRPNFGLGDATIAEVVRIEWPSGVVQELTSVPADQILHVIEPPELSIQSAVILSWAVNAEGYILYGADSPDGPWVEIDEEVTIDDNQATVMVKAAHRMQLYRLQQP